MSGWRTITSVVRTPCVSCSSLATVLCALRLSCVSQKTQTNRKENEQVENSLRQPCDLVFRTEVLRCCSQHREAAVRNQKICRRRKVHGCRKADVKGIQGRNIEYWFPHRRIIYMIKYSSPLKHHCTLFYSRCLL